MRLGNSLLKISDYHRIVVVAILLDRCAIKAGRKIPYLPSLSVIDLIYGGTFNHPLSIYCYVCHFLSVEVIEVFGVSNIQ